VFGIFCLKPPEMLQREKLLYLQIIIAFMISEDYWRLNAIRNRRRLENECTKLFIDLTLRNIET